MPFCSNCGKEVYAGVKFCGNCGAPQEMGSVTRGLSQKPSTTASIRPMAANVFLVSHVALGLLFAFLGLYVFTLELGAASVIFGLLLLAVGLASVLMGYGFFRLRRWLFRGGTLTSLGYVVGGLLLVRAAGDLIIAIGALAIILALGTLVYLRMKEFRALLTT